MRHFQAADLNDYIALFNDIPTRGDFFSPQQLSPEAIRREFATNGFSTDERETFALIANGDERLIGMITHFKSRTPICRELGFRLFATDLGRQGYMSEAVGVLCDYLFRSYAHQRIEMLMNVDNIASERVAQKNGFTYEGTMRAGFFINGKLSDSKVYSLLRSEWRPSR